MSPSDCFRLLVLCCWLLVCNVDCESTKKGHVLHVRTRQPIFGARNHNKGPERWIQQPIFKIPVADFKGVDQGQYGNIVPAQEDQTPHTKPSQSGTHHFSPFLPVASEKQIKSTGTTHPYEDHAFAVPAGKKHQSHPDHVGLDVPNVHHGRGKPSRFSNVQVNRPSFGSSPKNIKKLLYSHRSAASPNSQASGSGLESESHKSSVDFARSPTHQPKTNLTPKLVDAEHRFAHALPRNFNSNQKNSSPLKMIDDRTEVSRQMPPAKLRPRFFSSYVMPQVRGYTNTHRFRPTSEKAQPQASHAAGTMLSERHFSSVLNQGKYGYDSTKPGFGLVVQATQDRHHYPYYNSHGQRRGDRNLLHDTAQAVQGKFQPFQTLPDLPAYDHPPKSDVAPNQTYTKTTLAPSLDLTTITSSVAPSTTGEVSTKSASLEESKGQEAEEEPQVSEGSAEVGQTPEEDQTADLPPSQEKAEKDKGNVSSPPELDQSH